MISVSTSEIWQKCHGEDEKMIKAVFSMARKLYPCLVFVDEADAMLGARKAGERRHVRAMLNQFLMEWDGLMSGLDAPFVLLATNRPFDLDPAVLRRAPVQIHLDVPTSKERNGILRLLLREEKVQGIDFETLANLTKGYTGSDLKNLCVAAATTCVNAQSEDTSDRILLKEHFLTARSTIRPTNISTVNTKEMKRFEDKSGQDQTDIRPSQKEKDDTNEALQKNDSIKDAKISDMGKTTKSEPKPPQESHDEESQDEESQDESEDDESDDHTDWSSSSWAEPLDGLRPEEISDDSPSRREWLRQKSEDDEQNEWLDQLMSMVGLEEIKAHFLAVKFRIKACNNDKSGYGRLRLHLVLHGKDGVG
ncbi:spastin [Colletotrichum sp. SAR 10_96]|nr:spastin [Colletotrichum sp. SAR 10_96]